MKISMKHDFRRYFEEYCQAHAEDFTSLGSGRYYYRHTQFEIVNLHADEHGVFDLAVKIESEANPVSEPTIDHFCKPVDKEVRRTEIYEFIAQSLCARIRRQDEGIPDRLISDAIRDDDIGLEKDFIVIANKVGDKHLLHLTPRDPKVGEYDIYLVDIFFGSTTKGPVYEIVVKFKVGEKEITLVTGDRYELMEGKLVYAQARKVAWQFVKTIRSFNPVKDTFSFEK